MKKATDEVENAYEKQINDDGAEQNDGNIKTLHMCRGQQRGKLL